MLSRGIFLDKGDECIASFGQFPFLSQLRGRLKFRKADVRGRRRSNFSTLLFFYKAVVTEPGGAAKDNQRQQQHEEPLHGWQCAIAAPGEIRESRCATKC